MNEIKSFTFYRNYYELLDNIPDEDKKMLAVAILDYIFRDVEPIGLEKMNLAIWNNIKMPLDTSKKQALNGLKGGAPVGNQNATKNNPENNPKTTQETTQSTTQKQANNISTFLFLLSNFNFSKDRGLLRGKIEEWLKYKWERKEYYKETGFKSLLARIESATSQYGVEQVIDLIDECMANNYKGIIFEKLKSKTKPSNKQEPEWFNEEIKKEVDVDSQNEMEEILKDFMEEN